MLQRDADGGGEAVHEAGDGGTFFRHADEDLAGVAVGIEADGDVSLMVGDGELVGDRGALAGQAVADGARRRLGVERIGILRGSFVDRAHLRFERRDLLLRNRGSRCSGRGGQRLRGLRRDTRGYGRGGLGGGNWRRGHSFRPLRVRVRLRAHVQRLRALGVVAVDGNRLDAQAPRFQVGLRDVVDGAVLRQVHRLRDGAGKERLGGGHHLDVAHVLDAARALRRLERAVEHGEMLGPDAGCAFDGSGRVDVRNDGIGLLVRVTQLEQRTGHSVVDDLNHPAANQFLVLDQRQVRLNPRRVTVHHEAYCAGGS